ncbi:unnamed protein product [Caenorhabditis brenneri]
MSEIPSSDCEKPLEHPNEDLSEAMGQLTLTTADSDKVSPSLSDKPVEVVALIIDRSKYKQQLVLRKVSKSLRALVDRLKPACESVHYKYWDDSVTINFDEQYVMYSEDGMIYDDDMIGVQRDDFEKAALKDLAATLKNPRLQLKEFSVDLSLRTGALRTLHSVELPYSQFTSPGVGSTGL